MEDWAGIATEVAGAIGEVGFGATITRPGAVTGPEWAPVAGVPVVYDVTVIDSMIKVRDASGTLTGEMRRRLSIEAGVVVPAKGDAITVRGVAHTVDTVETLAPGGVDLLYYVTLER
jgi:hypothetical protein